MRRLFTIVACSFLLSACAFQGGTANNPFKRIEPSVRTVAIFVVDDRQKPVEGAQCELEDSTVEGSHAHHGTTNQDGYVAWNYVDTGLRATQVWCSKDGYAEFAEHRDLKTGGNEDLPQAVMHALHVDPSAIPLEDLSHIRGAMWSARLNVPYGPRPNRDDNILAMSFYSVYSPDDQARMLAAYKAHGYTHAVTGPVTGNDCYHGQFPCHIGVPTQEQWDAYLDELQAWWDAGIVPVYFAKPDAAWEIGDMAALDALYQQPRAQQLLRVVVYTGWEPWGDYVKTNAQWVEWVRHGAEVFPTALRLIHMTADIDAPTGGNDDKTFPAGQGNALSWRNVAPYLHGWLVQNAGYVFGSTPLPSPTFLIEFRKQFDVTNTASMINRFAHGYAGWPRSSAWGDGQRLRVYAGEYAAYADYWKNWPESEAVRLGDIAVAAGADGYLDGGTVPVP